MSQIVARPYAKALFEHAVATDTVALWAERLATLSTAVLTPEARSFLTHPASTLDQQKTLLLSLFSASDPLWDTLVRWVTVLLSEGRALALPEIAAQYLALQAEFEKTICVKVTTFSKLSAAQQKTLTEKLRKKLNRQVVLDIEKDKSLLGGMVIQAGDWVLDGSVRGKLKAMHAALCAS